MVVSSTLAVGIPAVISVHRGKVVQLEKLAIPNMICNKNHDKSGSNSIVMILIHVSIELDLKEELSYNFAHTDNSIQPTILYMKYR